jgi:hypothetical protein
MTIKVRTQARLLARHLRKMGLATLTHSQALEVLAHAQNVKSYAVLAAQGKAAAVPTTDRDRALALMRQARGLGLTTADALNVLAESRSPIELLYLETANDAWGREGELEFDDNAAVNLSHDRGAYVMGWRWVDQDSLPPVSNLARAFLMGYEQLGLDTGDDFLDIPLSGLELNQAALEAYQEGKQLEDSLWLVRSAKDAETRVHLTVADFRELKFDSVRECFKGTLRGQRCSLEFSWKAD